MGILHRAFCATTFFCVGFSFSAYDVSAETALPIKALAGETITLDPVDGVTLPAGPVLQPSWTWIDRPAASVADFNDATVLRPQVLVDIPGTYRARVSFTDASGAIVATSEVVFGSDNLPPVARVRVRGVPDGSSPVTLDGSASFDLEGDALSYSWVIESAPAGSAAQLSGDGPLSAISLDLEGAYRVALTVQDSTGAVSEPDYLDLRYLPNSGTTDVYRLSYEVNQTATAGVADTFDLGERAATSGTHDRISGFTLGDGIGAVADTLTVTLNGVTYSASSSAEFLALVDALELDTDTNTNARISPDPAQSDLTFIFGSAGGSVTLTGLVGDTLTRADLEDRGVDYYEGVGGRVVAPVPSARFDQLHAEVGVPLTIEPYASIDIDGDVLVADAGILVAPTSSSPQISTDIDGLSLVTVDQPGDYLFALDVADGSFSAQDHVLVVAGANNNLRPVARIAPVTSAQAGATLTLDGSQSYDLDGDFIQHSWALISAPAGSTAELGAEQAGTVVLTPDLPGAYVAQLSVEDDAVAGIPETVLITVGSPLPTANAGRDRLAGDLGQLALDGTLSSGNNLTYSWSSLGLTADGSDLGIDDATLALPTIGLETRHGRFRDVIRHSSVYHIKRPFDHDDDDYDDRTHKGRDDDRDHDDRGQKDFSCRFDTRQPADLGGYPGERVKISLKSRGGLYPRDGWSHGGHRDDDHDDDDHGYDKKRHGGKGDRDDDNHPGRSHWQAASIVWEIENKQTYTRDVTLQDSDGVSYGTWTVPGRTSLHVTTDNIGKARMYAYVDGVVRDTERAKKNPFNRNNPVCTGHGSGVVQLIVSDASGVSLADTIFVGNTNLRPVLEAGSKISLLSGQTVDLNASDYSYDGNADALTYGWSLISRPSGSNADIGAPIVQGEALTFAPDRVGTYLLQITAADDAMIAEPSVVMVEVVNSPPVAAVSGDTEVFVGDVATISAAGSGDPDGDALSYVWSLVSAPDGSTAAIAGQGQPSITFTPDRRGDYVFNLTVSDYEFDSAPVSWTLTAPNRAPVALLEGPDQVAVRQEVIYSAAGSNDPDNDLLTFSYAVTTKPAGSDPFFGDIGNNEAGFFADLPGDYVLEVTVSDGVLDATHTLAVNASALNAAPVLGQLRDSYTVELGLELALDLEGSDPDGDPISFFATPLPLATGVTLDGNNGEVRFRPETGQLGTYTYTVGVSDGVLTDEATLTIEVVEATAGDTAINGRVLDATDFAAGTITPLANVPVRLRDAALMTTTDADGSFSFGSLIAGSDQVEVDPSADGGPGGYLGATRPVTVTENQDRDISPDFLLVPLTDGCAPIVAGQATTLTGAASGVTVSIPADSVQDDTGAAYTGEVCLGSLPQLFDHAGFDENTQACRIYALDAPGAIFTQGMTITGPNLDNLPEQTRLEMWRVNQANGLFRRTANAAVDSGGATVSGTLSGVSNSALFTFLPQAPQTVASTDQPTGMKYLTPFEGDNATSYTLPGYTAFGEAQQITLSYHSQAANPTIIVAGDVTIADDASLPVALQTRIEAGGLSVSDGRSWTPRQGLDGSTPALVGEQVILRQSMPVDGSGLTSGRYAYRFHSKAMYECSTVGNTHMAEFYVQNETDSPYGKGWAIEGLQKLVQGPDGKVSIIDDDGVTTFDPEPTLTDFEEDPLVFPAVGADPGIAAGDLDNDGDLDVVFAESGTGAINTIINYGGRDFRAEGVLQVAQPSAVPQTGTYPPNLAAIALGELNNEKGIDVAYGLRDARGYGYVTNDGFGTLIDEFQQTGLRGLVLDVAVADIDQDGFDDIIYGTYFGTLFSSEDEVSVSYGGADGRTVNRIYSRDFGGDVPLQVLTGDIDGNGFVDVAFRSREGVNFIFNNGNRSYTARRLRAGNGGVFLLGDYAQLVDFDDDGKLDIVYSTVNDLQVLRNTTGQSFAAPVTLARPPAADAALSVAVGDANDDGLPDLIASGQGQVYVYHGNGDGTFQPFETGLVDYGFDVVDFVDINGDGSLDLLSTQRFSATIHFSKPSASGKFVSGQGDFSTLERLDDGTWQRRYKDGTIIVYDTNGLQTAEVDPQGNRKEYAYGDDGRLATITDQVGGVTSFTYEAQGRLETVTYPDGRVTAFEYDDIGNLNEVTEPIGSKVSFAYDENGRLVSTTNQNGNTTSYSYDAVGNLNGAVLPDGSSVANQVASSLGLIDGLGNAAPNPLVYVAPEDRVTTVTDRKGQITEVIVNQFGSVIQTTDPLGRVTKIERDDQNLAVRVERPSDSAPGGVRIDTVTYDIVGNVETMTEAVGTPAERTTSYTYEPTYNKVLTMTDGDGFTMSYTYDGFGEVTGMTDAEDGVRAYTYSPEGKLATRTDENGNVTSFTYNADQNLDSTTYADGSVTQMTYDAAGNTTVITEASGSPIERQVRRSYDSLNRVLSVEVTGADGANIGGVTEYTYLPAGNLDTVTDQTGLVTSMYYDGLERLVAIDDPAEGLIERVYNEAGEVVQHINGDGETHSYTYDEVSRLTQTTDPEGYVKSFTYDNRDNIATVTDGRDGLTSFAYDTLDRMTTRTNPIDETMTRAYDNRGNLTTLTREDGLVETASYDGLSRRTQVVTPDNTLIYGYDPRSNLTLAADDDSRVTFTYDTRNRVATTTTDGTVGPQPQVTLTYSYDLLDRRTRMEDSLGGATDYVWDAEDRLTDLTSPWGSTYSFGYDDEGRRTALTSTSGRATRYAYTNGLLSALTHAQSGVTLTDLEYTYDPDGQLTAILDRLDPAQSKHISYDDLNRLVQVRQGIPPIDGGVPVPIEDYAYDEEGNRTFSTNSGGYESNAHNQLLEDDTYRYAYDARGNRISRTEKATDAVETYAYDSQNRLIGYGSDSSTAAYAYDALDRRIAKTVGGNGTAYVYDYSTDDPLAHDDITLEFDTSGPATLTRRWAHSNAVDEPVGFEEYTSTSGAGAGSERAMFADRQGSVLWVTDPASGSVVASYEYDGYGQVAQTFGALMQPYGYTGREYDLETGLYYYRARVYDPATGKFLQMDPIGFASGSHNLYTYANRNPFNFNDPDGLTATSPKLVVTAGAVAEAMSATAHVGVGLLGAIGSINRVFHLASNVLAMAGIGHNNPPREEPSEEEKQACLDIYDAAMDAAGMKYGICKQIAETEPKASSRKRLLNQCGRQYGWEKERAAEDLAACLGGE
ncbi:RHS repeat-associated core domain-containing protein [Ruegeria sp.]|uniref:PKD domain-containing protein n=1 Tax=Ruegeria sp. TaxID=1879320 RepID=UPI0023269690|nr:RHS repeat-associated core domain-containing protein [Ruegeria sp.]MDA7966140.1 FG-GAP-like repeat-containing protein [Ruegeria sp.]